MEVFSEIFFSFTTTGLVVLLTLLAHLYLTSLRPKNFPPGPPVLPIVGSIPFLNLRDGQYMHEMERLHKKYGGIFSAKLGDI